MIRPWEARSAGMQLCDIRNGARTLIGEYFVPLLCGDVFNFGGLKDTGVVDQKIDLSEMASGQFGRLLGALVLAKVAFNGKALNTGGFHLTSVSAPLPWLTSGK